MLLGAAVFAGACGGGGTRPDLPSRILQLSAFPVGIDPDGSEASTLMATVYGGAGHLLQGAEVTFETNIGVLGFESERTVVRTTARDGMIYLTLRGDGERGIATVTATSGEASAFAEVLIR